MPRAAHMNEQQIRACSSLTQLYHSLVPSAHAFSQTGSNLPRDMKSSSLTHRPRESVCNVSIEREKGFPFRNRTTRAGWALAAGALSINLSFKKHAAPFVERSRREKKQQPHNNQNSTRRGKREVWHALLNPAPLFAFDSKSYNDTQAPTKLRNEAETEGEKRC